MSNPRAKDHSHTPPHIASLIVGPTISGTAEIAIFHSFDTISKRLQKNSSHGTSSQQAMFADSYGKSYAQQIASLYKGSGQAVLYKVVQRVYKFGGQPLVKSGLHNTFGKTIEDRFGKQHGKVLIEAIAGSIIGIGEVAILPLDALKVRGQLGVKPMRWTLTPDLRTFPTSVKFMMWRRDIFTPNLKILYRGAGWTAARNAPGSFCLFGTDAFVKEYFFGLKKYSDATFSQEVVGSVAGSIASVTVTNPLDVVKTRIQAEGRKKTGTEVVRNLIHHEGFFAFGKGLVPKLITAAPKVAFSMTVAKTLIKKIDAYMQSPDTNEPVKPTRP